jgi:hypothetical protein
MAESLYYPMDIDANAPQGDDLESSLVRGKVVGLVSENSGIFAYVLGTPQAHALMALLNTLREVSDEDPSTLFDRSEALLAIDSAYLDFVTLIEGTE